MSGLVLQNIRNQQQLLHIIESVHISRKTTMLYARTFFGNMFSHLNINFIFSISEEVKINNKGAIDKTGLKKKKKVAIQSNPRNSDGKSLTAQL